MSGDHPMSFFPIGAFENAAGREPSQYQPWIAVPRKPTSAHWETDWTLSHVDFNKLPEPSLARQHSGMSSLEMQYGTGSWKPQAANKQPEAASSSASLFPQPTMSLPPPTLEFDFRMLVNMNASVASVAVPGGHKNIATFAEGSWSGPFGAGVVLAGSLDSQNFFDGDVWATKIETVYRLQTRDEPPAQIELRTRGYRTGPAEVMKAVESKELAATVDPRQYRFRIFITMKTADERYANKINFGMWVGTALWRDLQVVYDAYRVG